MANKKALKGKVISGLAWSFGERICAQVVSFIVTLVLARILAPSEFGSVAILLVFIEIANVFVSNGLGNALVQKKDADIVDFSSVFYINIALSVVIYAVLFFISPLVASFYSNDALTPMLRVLSVKILLAGINSIQHAFVQRNMMFKRFFFSTIIGTVVSGFVGIGLAVKGFGARALVAQYLTNSFMDTVILWVTVKWRPHLVFSFERVKPLIKYGSRLLSSALLHSIYTNLRSLLIGKYYTSADLAYYNQGNKIPQLVVTNINTSINSVLFPAMSSTQDNREQLKQMVRKSIRCASLIIWPLMIGVASTSNEIIQLLLSPKWLPCVPFLAIACFQFAFEPVNTSNLQAIKAMGRSDLCLKMEVIKKAYGILIIFVTIRYGVLAIAWGALSQNIVALAVNTFPNKKLLSYSYKEQLSDILPPFIISIIMGVAVFLFGKYIGIDSLVVKFILQVILGVVIYVVGVFATSQKSIAELISYIKK